MHSAENLEVIESEGRRLLAFAAEDPERAVPQYPGWRLFDLVSHTASILGRTTLICQTLPQERISAPRLPEGMGPLEWFRATLAEMLQALREADPSAQVWAFGLDHTIGFWERRMVVETGIHRWDAQQAISAPDPLPDHVAVTALDEFADMWLPRLDPVPPLEVEATDLGRRWVFGPGPAELKASGTASDVYLRLMSRPGAALPDVWESAVDALGAPPKR